MLNSILSQIALAYSPVIDRNRQVTATRLTVYPINPGTYLDASKLLEAISDVWPVSSGGQVWLNVADEELLIGLMQSQPATHICLEIPAFMACMPKHAPTIQKLHANGNILLLSDRPNHHLAQELLECFTYSSVSVEDERRKPRIKLDASTKPEPTKRDIDFVQTGVSTVSDMELSFQRGAMAVLGWPIDDVIQVSGSARQTEQPSLQIVIQLIDQIQREEKIELLEKTIKHDPALAYKLLRYINSPAFGLSVEISSFRHAIMVLGYQRLKRWLALLLTMASKDPNMRPVMFAAVRRGLLMEHLGRGRVNDEQVDELFICGIFSLLDRMFNKSFEALFESIPVTERIFQALSEGKGPYKPYLDLITAMEGLGVMDIRESCNLLLLSMEEANVSLLNTLKLASSFQD